jgi:hypothetical protein
MCGWHPVHESRQEETLSEIVHRINDAQDAIGRPARCFELLASSGQDGTIMLWNPESSARLTTLRADRRYEQMGHHRIDRGERHRPSVPQWMREAFGSRDSDLVRLTLLHARARRQVRRSTRAESGGIDGETAPVRVYWQVICDTYPCHGTG